MMALPHGRGDLKNLLGFFSSAQGSALDSFKLAIRGYGSMFAELPDTLKQDVLFYLNQDNFPKAKAVHDAWKDNKNYLPSSVDPSCLLFTP